MGTISWVYPIARAQWMMMVRLQALFKSSDCLFTDCYRYMIGQTQTIRTNQSAVGYLDGLCVVGTQLSNKPQLLWCPSFLGNV